jgi:hypothetical protein
LIVGGVFAVLALALELYAGGVLAYGETVPMPPAWWGFIIGAVLGIVGPIAVFVQWRVRSRQRLSIETKLAGAELVGVSVGIVTSFILLLIIGMLSVI